MLSATLLEFFLRGIPEGFLFIFAGYTFSKTRVNVKKFIISGFVLGMIGYLVRFLPISFGVHSVLILIACILMLNAIHKIPLIKAISSGLIMMIIAFAAEIINGILIAFFRGFSLLEIIHDFKVIDIEFVNATQKLLYGLPSLTIMGLVLTVIYMTYKKKDKLTDAVDRKNIE